MKVNWRKVHVIKEIPRKRKCIYSIILYLSLKCQCVRGPAQFKSALRANSISFMVIKVT